MITNARTFCDTKELPTTIKRVHINSTYIFFQTYNISTYSLYTNELVWVNTK